MKSAHPSISKEEKQRKGEFSPRISKSKKEEQEFGKGEMDIIMCPECTIFYYYKSWHHNLRNYKHLKDEKRIKFVRCPACEMINNGKYEGQIILRGILPERRVEISRLVHNIASRAFKRDPLDRVVKMKFSPKGGEILTTENQLALSIAKQIKRAFRGDLKINWSHQESVVRITNTF